MDVKFTSRLNDECMLTFWRIRKGKLKKKIRQLAPLSALKYLKTAKQIFIKFCNDEVD
jgi:hypothetical protein